jgi:hypothetical protein
LLKEAVLNLSSGARWFITHGTKRNFTFHVRKWEEITLIGLDDVLVKTRCALGAEFVTRIYVLGWRTLTRHIRSSAIKHCIGTASTAVESTGLGIHENFISCLD